jgi:amino acid transporter
MADPEHMSDHDVEKHATDRPSSSDVVLPVYDKAEQDRRASTTSFHDSGFFSAFTLASFKRNPNARVVMEGMDNEGRPLKD